MLAIVVLACLGLCAPAWSALPADFMTCKSSDEECLKKAVINAVKIMSKGDRPKMFHQTDPLHMETIHIPGNGGSVDIDQKYEGMLVTGLADSTVQKISVNLDPAKCSISFTSFTPEIKFIGKYRITGKLMMFTLNGKGKADIDLFDLTVQHHINCEINGDKLKIKKYKIELLPKKLTYDLENVIEGNAELSAEVLRVVNENNLDIFNEIRDGYEATYAEAFKDIGNSVFDNFSIKELFKD